MSSRASDQAVSRSRTSALRNYEDDKTFKFQDKKKKKKKYSCNKYLKDKKTRTARCNEWDKTSGKQVLLFLNTFNYLFLNLL